MSAPSPARPCELEPINPPTTAPVPPPINAPLPALVSQPTMPAQITPIAPIFNERASNVIQKHLWTIRSSRHNARPVVAMELYAESHRPSYIGTIPPAA